MVPTGGAEYFELLNLCPRYVYHPEPSYICIWFPAASTKVKRPDAGSMEFTVTFRDDDILPFILFSARRHRCLLDMQNYRMSLPLDPDDLQCHGKYLTNSIGTTV